MKKGKPIVTLGAAALAAAGSAIAIWMMRDGGAPPKATVEPNPFSFIKPLDYTGQDIQGKPSAAAQPSAPSAAAQASIDVAAAQAAAQKMRMQGAGMEDVNRMRAAALPPETAARLARLDSAEAAWKVRVDAYLEERRRLFNDLANVAASDRNQALRQLRDSRFTSEEQALLANYETSGLPQLIQDAAVDPPPAPAGALGY
jgi:hypothetical protein